MSTTEHELDRSDVGAADVDAGDVDDAGDERVADAADVDRAGLDAHDGTRADSHSDVDGHPADVSADGERAGDDDHVGHGERAGDDGSESVPAAVDGGTIDEPEPYDLPEIVLVSEASDDDAVAKSDSDSDSGDDDDDDDEYVVPDASPDVLEELRRADIDGPLVDAAPQDDGTNAKRRPKRSADYDPAPIPIPLRVPRILGRKPRVRKVTRVVRHVDPWSIFKIAAIAHLVVYAIVMTAGVLLWNVAYATGTVENIERFFESFGWSSFEFNGGEIYHAAWIAGLFAVLGLTGLAVLTATLFNLITDLVGGVRVTVLEEEVVESRTTPMRRFVVRRTEPEVPAVIRDPSGVITREAIPDESDELPR